MEREDDRLFSGAGCFDCGDGSVNFEGSRHEDENISFGSFADDSIDFAGCEIPDGKTLEIGGS